MYIYAFFLAFMMENPDSYPHSCPGILVKNQQDPPRPH